MTLEVTVTPDGDYPTRPKRAELVDVYQRVQVIRGHMRDGTWSGFAEDAGWLLDEVERLLDKHVTLEAQNSYERRLHREELAEREPTPDLEAELRKMYDKLIEWRDKYDAERREGIEQEIRIKYLNGRASHHHKVAERLAEAERVIREEKDPQLTILKIQTQEACASCGTYPFRELEDHVRG